MQRRQISEEKVLYGRLEKKILHVGEFGKITLPQLLNFRTWPVIIGAGVVIGLFLLVLESSGV